MAASLPTGPRPGWELDESDDDDLHTPAESLTVLESLRQSRQRWLCNAFPKFSTKTRGGKPAEVTPPAHTARVVARCDLQIGPHTFLNTSVIEASYNLPSVSRPPLPSGSGVSPDLISQVNFAASSNPQLANLLQLVGSGRANGDQLRTLGLIIQSLPHHPQAPPGAVPYFPMVALFAAPPAAAPPTLSAPHTNNFDVVLEFREKPSTRWRFSRGPAVCERVPLETPGYYDVVITTLAPSPTSQEMPVRGQRALATFTFANAPPQLWDLLIRWAGGEQAMAKNKAILDDLLQTLRGRSYLQHRLPDCDLLDSLQEATANRYPMKPIKPGLTTQQSPARKVSTPRARKANKGKARPVDSDMPPPAVPPKALAKAKADAQQAPASPSIEASWKRRKLDASPRIIVCQVCGTPDVPLLLRGRYCRPCIDDGKVPNLINPSLPATS